MQSLEHSSSLLMRKLSSGQSCHEVWLSKLSWAHQGVPDDGERLFVSLQALSASLLLEQVCDPQGMVYVYAASCSGHCMQSLRSCTILQGRTSRSARSSKPSQAWRPR